MVGNSTGVKTTSGNPCLGRGYQFLSVEWVGQVTRVVQAARSTDKEFGKLASGFSMSLAYLITEVPQTKGAKGSGNKQAIFVKLDQGAVRKLSVGSELPSDRIDFTVVSSYEVAKKIFLGELNAATSFIRRELKVEPMSRVYRNPGFTAKSIVAGNLMLKIARRVPTLFPAEPVNIKTSYERGMTPIFAVNEGCPGPCSNTDKKGGEKDGRYS